MPDVELTNYDESEPRLAEIEAVDWRIYKGEHLEKGVLTKGSVSHRGNGVFGREAYSRFRK